ncbi:hypothetical protein QJS66_12935 [Kocuria rhizophila]|nr:hypothetical protein QJS66_12935 [Kocuria rhizophila]
MQHITFPQRPRPTMAGQPVHARRLLRDDDLPRARLVAHRRRREGSRSPVSTRRSLRRAT